MRAEENGKETEVMEETVEHILGPSMVSFVQWVLDHAVRSGKKRLYFLARDGYLMYRTAVILCRRQNLPLQCRYVSCSRYSLRVPMFYRNTEEALAYICRGGMDVTLGKILGRAGLTEEETRRIAAVCLSVEPDTGIPYAKLPVVRAALSACPEFLEQMNCHSREAFPRLARYLFQEGFLEGVSDAVVDSGWTGSLQKTLNEILALLGRKRSLEGYYWGMYELPAGVNPALYHCYDFGPEGNLRRKVRFNNCLFEAVFSAPHGMTLGYREEGGRMHPCYGEIGQKEKEFQKKMERYVVRYAEKGRADKKARKRLGRFMAHPTPEEAEVFGAIPFSDDVTGKDKKPVAKRLSQKALREHHIWFKLPAMLGYGREPQEESAWYEGSAVLGARGVRFHLWQYTLYKYIRYLRKMRRSRKGKKQAETDRRVR